jgi:hypothetical protein
MQAPPQQTIAQEAMTPVGIQNLQSNLPTQMATGGIVAFSTGNQVKDQAKERTLADEMLAIKAAKEAYGITGAVTPEAQAYLAAQKAAAASPEDRKQQEGARWLQAGLGILGEAGPFAMQNIGRGAAPALAGYSEDVKGQRAAGLASLKAQADLAEARRAEQIGDVKTAADLFEKRLDRDARANIARDSQLGAKYADNYVKTRKSAGDGRPDEVIRDEGYLIFFRESGFAGPRVAAQERIAAGQQGVQTAGQLNAAQIADADRKARADEAERRNRNAAVDAWDKLNEYGPKKREYNRTKKTDPQAAEAFREKFISENMAPRSGSSATPAAPAKPTPAAPSSTAYPVPEQAHINYLKQNPKFAADFDKKFGPGASKAYLK